MAGNPSFQDRFARLAASQEAELRVAGAAPKPVPVASEPAAPKKTTKPAAKPIPRIAWDMVLMPILLVFGFAAVIGVRVAQFHLLSDAGWYLPDTPGDLSVFLRDIALELAVPLGLLGVLLMRNLWLSGAALAIGTLAAKWQEPELLRAFPEIWAQMYTPAFVEAAISYMEQNPQLY